ncbi:MAG: lactate utilization protein, partial [Methanobacteriota archaeon]
MPKGRQRLAAEVRRSIEEPERIGKLWEAMERGRANRAATIEQAGLDLPVFRDRVRSIKETAAQDPSIAEAFADAVRANGGRVLFAATGREAVRYLLDVCRAQGAEFLVKSKSLTSEEIEMNQGLAAEGIRAIETDLGELLCQVAGEKPSHLVFPAIHMTSDRIAKMLTEEYGEPIASEPSSILSAVRAKLRPLFLAAKVGVTGA